MFRNETDDAWQVARQDGTGVIIINNVPEGKAAILLADFAEAVLCMSTPTKALKFVLSDFNRRGYNDQFNSTLSGIAETLSRKEGQTYGTDGLGLYVREGKPVEAVRIEGSGRFQGPVVHEFDKGAVLIRHENDPNKVNLCQTHVFEKTYVTQDGNPARAEDLPVGFQAAPASPWLSFYEASL